MNKLIILSLSLIIMSSSFATQTMRKCMLLPIRDSVDGAIAFKVFELVEAYLKDSEWCYYRSNSEILNIFSNYKNNLDNILKSKEVLKIVGEKTKTGSLIKIDIVNQVKGADVKIKVIGPDGDDLYFKEETRLNTDDYTVIAQTIKNWLDVYEKSIPYNGRVIGVLGNQFTVDFGTVMGAFPDTEVIVYRPIRKRRHPLLKEIVDWETEKIGSGKVIHATKNQTQAQILQYDTKKRLRVEDWVVIKEADKQNFAKKKKFEETDTFEYGKLGTIGLMFALGTASATSNNGTNKKIGGLVFGVDLNSKVWLTRKYWFGVDISKSLGTLKQKEGTLTNSSNSLSSSKFALKGGYKYLPLGFFYGPQVDAWLGYASYTYGLDTQVADGFTEVSFKGIELGATGSVPFYKIFRVNLGLSLIFNPTYTEESVVYGEDDSASTYAIDIGGTYAYSPSMSFDASYGVNSSKAKFITPARNIKLKESKIKIGSTFTF
jgi:hypothetical protein